MSRARKKILFIANYFYPHIGGVEKHLLNVSNELCKRFDISILTKQSDERLYLQEQFSKLKVYRFLFPDKKYLGLIKIWIEIFKKRELIRQADIVHVHDVFIWYLPFRFIYFRKPIFLTYHGWEGTYPIPRKNIIFKRISSYLSKGSISVGYYIQKYYGVTSDFVTFGGVKNLVNKIKKSKKKIVYIGRLSKDNNLEILLKCLSYLRDYKIEFCGDGALANECSKYGAVHGFVDPTPYLLDAEICFSSGYLTMLEAFSNKCVVVVAFDNVLRKDCLKMTPFSDWLIYDYSSKRLSYKIRERTNNTIERKKIISTGYVWVTKQTWESVADLYLQLWKKYNAI